jgi:hypothetical protein
MKRTLVLALALTAASSAFALPHSAPVARSTQTLVPDATLVHVQETPKATPVLVADNRKEFGSQYQRY